MPHAKQKPLFETPLALAQADGTPVHPSNLKPYAITPAQREQLVLLIARGLPMTSSCAKLGIRYETFCDWMERGGHANRHGKTTVDPDDAVEPYKSFVAAIRAAEIDAETVMVDALMGAADRDWRAAMFYLKTRRPDEWGDKSAAVNVEANGGVTIFLPSNGRDDSVPDL